MSALVEREIVIDKLPEVNITGWYVEGVLDGVVDHGRPELNQTLRVGPKLIEVGITKHPAIPKEPVGACRRSGGLRHTQHSVDTLLVTGSGALNEQVFPNL